MITVPGFSEDDWKTFSFNPKRLTKMTEGAGIIQSFLQLVLRQGILSGEALSEDNLNELATRLVDTQIPSAARKVKSFIQITVNADSLPLLRFDLTFMGNLARLILDFENQPLHVRLNLWQLCGAVIPKQIVNNQKGILDRWKVFAIHTSKEDSLTSRKTWFKGKESNFCVFTMDYSFANQPLPKGYKLNDVIIFNAKFYPGIFPGRVLIDFERENRLPPSKWNNQFSDIEGMRQWIANIVNLDPLMQELPVSINDVRLVLHQERFYIVDKEKKYIELNTELTESYYNKDQMRLLYAIAGGKPLEMELMYSKGKYYALKNN